MLAPDRLVNAVVERWLSRQSSAFVFDGYPRSLSQACALETMLADRNKPLEAVLLLEADLPIIRERVSRRMTCERCGRIFSVGLHVSDGGVPCPACGGRLTKRSDDTLETLEFRMAEYANKTAPLIDHFDAEGLLHHLDAAQSPETVFSSVSRILERA